MRDLISNFYFHIPFCKTICNYCGFTKQLKNKSEEEKYIAKLVRDIKTIDQEIETIYIGGGTPSSLELQHIKTLLDEFDTLTYKKDYEFTFECNPDDVTIELLELLSKSKINRISLGIQSFNDDELKFLGRRHDSKKALESIELIKKYYKNFSVDLMFGFKDQTKESFQNNIDMINKIKPPHVSLYNLIIKENTKFDIDKELNHEDDGVISLQEKFDELTNLEHYEIANYAIKGYESKHNCNIWKYKPYIGFGYGACSRFNNALWEQKGELVNYRQTKTDILYDLDHYLNIFMLGLRTSEGVDIKKHESAFKHYKNVINDNKKYFNISEKLISVKKEYWCYLNNILLLFMD